MKVYLQHSQTRLYYATPTPWVATRAFAESFSSTLKALECARQHDITDALLVLSFDDDEAGRMDMTLPIPKPQTPQDNAV
jgi:hypothetical protein